MEKKKEGNILSKSFKVFKKTLIQILAPILILSNSILNFKAASAIEPKKNDTVINEGKKEKEEVTSEKNPLRNLKESKLKKNKKKSEKTPSFREKFAAQQKKQREIKRKNEEEALERLQKEEELKGLERVRAKKKEILTKQLEKQKIQELEKTKRIRDLNELLNSLENLPLDEDKIYQDFPKDFDILENQSFRDKVKEHTLSPVEVQETKNPLPSWMKQKGIERLAKVKSENTKALILKIISGSVSVAIYTELLDESIKFFNENPTSSFEEFIQEKSNSPRFKNLLAAGITCSLICFQSDNLIKLFTSFY